MFVTIVLNFFERLIIQQSYLACLKLCLLELQAQILQYQKENQRLQQSLASHSPSLSSLSSSSSASSPSSSHAFLEAERDRLQTALAQAQAHVALLQRQTTKDHSPSSTALAGSSAAEEEVREYQIVRAKSFIRDP